MVIVVYLLQSPSNVEARLARLICRGYPRIDDDTYTYILVADKLSSADDFEDWLPHIRKERH